ncbi:hypothetical protein K5E40_33660, partial [Pseudomonas baetica]|nr:hypothetical protein [Pseudomonas baetica]
AKCLKYVDNPGVSGLAREGGVSGNRNIDWYDAFASKPAHTGIVDVLQAFGRYSEVLGRY